MKYPYRLGIVDLGTNSIRFAIYEIPDFLEHRLAYQKKEMIRLGDGVYSTGYLDKEAYQRCLNEFIEISKIAKTHQVDKIIALATSALRNAKDKEILIEEVYEKTKIKIEVIKGEREARLIAKGILHNQPTPDSLFALVDIGGGSTEISICNQMNVLDSFSFHLGANRLQQNFLKSIPPPSIENIQKLREYISKTVQETSHDRLWPKIPLIIGSSGTIRAFRKNF